MSAVLKNSRPVGVGWKSPARKASGAGNIVALKLGRINTSGKEREAQSSEKNISWDSWPSIELAQQTGYFKVDTSGRPVNIKKLTSHTLGFDFNEGAYCPYPLVQSPSNSLSQAIGLLKLALELHKGTPQYQQAVLDVMEYTSQRAAEIIPPESIDLVKNNGISPVRAAIFKVFERTRRLLGRDSDAVILEDTAEHFRRLSKEIDLSTSSTVRGRNGSNPFVWINENVVPLLDLDMRKRVEPIRIGENWTVPFAQPFFHLQKKLHVRILNRIARLL